jgi:hypothetical protein
VSILENLLNFLSINKRKNFSETLTTLRGYSKLNKNNLLNSSSSYNSENQSSNSSSNYSFESKMKKNFISKKYFFCINIRVLIYDIRPIRVYESRK